MHTLKTGALLLATSLIGTQAYGANADAIYFGGPIITINDKAPSAEAVAVKNGKIVAVGNLTDVLKAEKGNNTVLNNLQGRTLLPGFFDSHGHLYATGFLGSTANLLPPPDGPGASIPDLQKALRAFIPTSWMVKQYRVVIGMNYDESQLVERRPPTRQELDAVSTTMPVVAIHQSGHIGVLNSKALAMVGYNADTPNPPGGVIVREADGKTPNGVLQENAYFMAAAKLVPAFTPAENLSIIEAGLKVNAANGYTTVQDGKADASTIAALEAAAKAHKLFLDVVIYADLVSLADTPVMRGPLVGHTYTNRLRIGGVKLTLDGSPQGKTAWFTVPYYREPPGQKPDYAGYPAFQKPGEAEGWIDLAYKNKWQLLVHANGDAAIDQLIAADAASQRAHPSDDRRTVLIHGQYLRRDQIPLIKAQKIFPSLFPMHTYYWGDWHRESVGGPERAAFISPTAAVHDAGMMFGIHHDAPVTFPNSMRVLDSAVNRTTRTGFVLGPDQRIPPLLALYAMTLWPAWQSFEEASKGSLEVGKLADLVILSANPLTVPPATLYEIKVDQTIKDGKTVYQRSSK